MVRCHEAIVIGASAGAVETLSMILPLLPAGFSLPIAVVVHVPPDKYSRLAELFASKCTLPVREAQDKEPIAHGTIYFAPPNYHLLIEPDRSFSLSSDDPVLFSRPSIDVLFESAADCFGPGLVGVILTGANHDGAAGLRAIHEAGGQTVIQNPVSAFSAAMPTFAAAACPAALLATPHAIAEFLIMADKK